MNILTLLEMAVDAHPDRVAFGPVSQGITCSRLLELSRSAARCFTSGNAESVVLCDESSAAVPIALFGAASAGLPYVPLNYRLPDSDLRDLARRSSPAVVIADTSNPARLAGLDAIELVDRNSLLEPTAMSVAGPPSAVAPDDPDAIAVLLFTSGTTGEPKSAVLRHRHLASYVLATVEFDGAGDDEATLVSVPPYHIAGVAAMLSSVFAGRRIVMLPRFEAGDWIDTVEREGITHAMVVPTMLARIVDALEHRGGEPLLGLRSLSYGGGRMPLPVIRRALELFPITSFVNAYGLTETSSTIALLGPDEHRLAQYSDDPIERRRLSSVGRPVAGIELAIRDENGADLRAGETGEIVLRGPQVSGEYLDHGSRPDCHGWFSTRDSGMVDSDGYVFVLGRNDDLIIRGGENLSPGEIEDVVASHPSVRDVAAFGVCSNEWGECVAVAVVAAEVPPTEDEVRELVRDKLRSSRVPEHVVIVDELPYNDTGKLLRRVLRERFSHLGDDAHPDDGTG